MGDLGQRVATALVGAVLVVSLLWLGGPVFAALIVVVALAAQYELYRMMRAAGAHPLVGIGLAAGVPAVLWPVVPGLAAALAVALLLLIPLVLWTRADTPLLDISSTAFGVLYPALLASSLVALRMTDAAWLTDRDAFWLTLAALMSVWAADSFAYIAGRLFGKNPLFSRVSPKKTWEGAAGGLIGAAVFVAAFKLLALDDVLRWGDVAVIAIAAGVLGPIGDLTESLFKRSVDVKDSASWLPGHGGLLDRIDATLIALPVMVLWFELTRGLL